MSGPPSPARTAILDRGNWVRLAMAGAVMGLVVLAGTGGYAVLGGGRWSAEDCLYMAVITISTVGYGETLPGLHEVPGAVAWTMVLIVLGSGSMLYFASSLTALIVEGDLGGAMRRRRMQRRIDELSDHIIVCGAGSTGRHVLDELARGDAAVVVVDIDGDRLEAVRREFSGRLYGVQGDATVDAVLHAAGIERARGVVLALTEDRDNVYAAVTARSLAPDVRIVAKAVEAGAADKLRRAGADEVVSPAELGGRRMASRLLRPRVLDFFTQLTGGTGVGLEEVAVPQEGAAVGRTLSELALGERLGVLIVGIRSPDGSWITRPTGSTRIEVGSHLMAIGEHHQVERLRQVLVEGR
ncbi:MAG: potassium channel protein [Deltaproteobacteria bacterium]|nr:MAG: potassium channel protein [Deltaproteobacteria bacterium]